MEPMLSINQEKMSVADFKKKVAERKKMIEGMSEGQKMDFEMKRANRPEKVEEVSVKPLADPLSAERLLQKQQIQARILKRLEERPRAKSRSPSPPRKKTIFEMNPREKFEKEMKEMEDVWKISKIRGKALAKKRQEFREKYEPKGYTPNEKLDL